MDYGKDERFAQLVDQCFEFKEIEYTYSVCLFGKAYQKSNSDTSLGYVSSRAKVTIAKVQTLTRNAFCVIRTFSEWVGDNYDTQLYTGGVKCWNGPDRSVKVSIRPTT